MKVLLLAAIVAFGLLRADGALWNFEEMIWKITGKEAASAYGFYGCHCGWGGRGAPLDATDWCCAIHDCCYDRLEKLGCWPKLQDYDAEYFDKYIICGNQDDCETQVCECDRAVAYCFARNQKTYNTKYLFYGKRKCHGKSPKCSELNYHRI
ncbi:phospholipase A2, membrane associated-like isoform X2 [Erinaceus europaeus]|uniref:Phospholipase A2 n=1 Tax=Erinaceus europaeus TaxID=9365 RepID=A0ABM3Y783_ERIEU|nr:phospholipase A2, membrane associated-like isoform X2 [Erinaceus europaeus]